MKKGEILKALEICADMGTRCQHETDKDCPYRDPEKKNVCDRKRLMEEAAFEIRRVWKWYDDVRERLDNVRVAVCGPLDSEHCVFECGIPEGEEP